MPVGKHRLGINFQDDDFALAATADIQGRFLLVTQVYVLALLWGEAFAHDAVEEAIHGAVIEHNRRDFGLETQVNGKAVALLGPNMAPVGGDSIALLVAVLHSKIDDFDAQRRRFSIGGGLLDDVSNAYPALGIVLEADVVRNLLVAKDGCQVPAHSQEIGLIGVR